MGNGQWAMGIKRSDRVFHKGLCPMPHAPCPMPHAPCPFPTPHSPFPEPKDKAKVYMIYSPLHGSLR
ncbi:hypothetical protein [Tolypothrix sp. VBCCA 56010]|uniref:hypothetical protein n=1 Tax=Tolypothrix sp. VBCCA 56010 TaxID=3137731 RepID=UPI003D7CE7F2